MSKYTDKSRDYRYKYERERLKRVPLDVQTQDYDAIKSHAAARGESVNGFIKRAISETMERDAKMPCKA